MPLYANDPIRRASMTPKLFAGDPIRRQRYSGGASTPTPAAASTPTPATGGTGGATAAAGGSEIMDLYRQALERLSGGGAALEANLADIEAGKQQAIARGQQALVSGGLGGTTVMGGVPIAAEKGAGRARLAARGQAEEKYLGTLMSYAGFAQRAQESAAERKAAMQRLQMQLGSQERMAGQRSMAGVTQPTQAYAYGASLTPDIPRTTVSGLGPTTAYSQQFPSIYGRGEAEEQTPNWMAA